MIFALLRHKSIIPLDYTHDTVLIKIDSPDAKRLEI